MAKRRHHFFWPPSDKAWISAHGHFFAPRNLRPSPVIEKAMLATNDFLSGWAIWRRTANIWAVIDCSNQLSWIKPLNVDKAKLELLRRGFTWKWIPVDQFNLNPSVNTEDGDRAAAPQGLAGRKNNDCLNGSRQWALKPFAHHKSLNL